MSHDLSRRRRLRLRRLAGAAREVLATLQKRVQRRLFYEARDFPEFLVIGAQKAGTTWLHENLRHHPGLFLPPEKEVHYFDRDYFRPLAGYVERFRDAGGRVRGEVTPAYSSLAPRRVGLIRRLRPDLRIVMLLRDPVERAWSASLMDLVRDAGRRLEDVPDAAFLAHFRSRHSRLRGDYVRSLRVWSVFPPEQMLIGWYEDIAARPDALLREVFAHLGVDAGVDLGSFPLRGRFNANDAVPMPARFRRPVYERYAPMLDALERRFGPRVAAWRERHARALQETGS